MRLAIVVPTLNEEDTLRRYLPAALAAADELIVSDGGSGDGTVALARELGARVVTGPPGRGGQLNRGAAAATADVLLFLHADTTLPEKGVERLREAVARGAPGGAFFLRFDVDRPMQRLGSRLINWRTRRLRVPLGDQAQFATRETFESLRWIPRLADPGRPGLRPAAAPARGLHADRGAGDHRRPPLRGTGSGADGGDELADLDPLLLRRLAAPPGAAVPADPVGGNRTGT